MSKLTPTECPNSFVQQWGDLPMDVEPMPVETENACCQLADVSNITFILVE